MSPSDCFLLLCLLPQDILTILCLKGPATEGIFRKAASEKARKELKEELNCGGSVNLNQLPVHLLAVVFKVSRWPDDGALTNPSRNQDRALLPARQSQLIWEFRGR